MRGKVPPRFAAFLIWASTIAWVAISAFGTGYSYMEFRDVRREWGYAKKLRNGRRLVAMFRMRTAAAFAAGFGVSSFVGFLATLGLFFGPSAKNEPDASVQTSVLRVLLNGMLVAFLIAQRNQRVVRKRLEHLADLETKVENRMDTLQESVEDTRDTAHDIRDKLEGKPEQDGD